MPCHLTRSRPGSEEFFVSQDCHPQTIAVLQTRAEPLDITLHVGNTRSIKCDNPRLSGLLLQYPTTDGYVGDYQALVEQAHKAGMLVVVATDLLALTLLRPPGEFGADLAVGSSQRFGVPMGFGGPHAAFLSAKEDYKRQIAWAHRRSVERSKRTDCLSVVVADAGTAHQTRKGDRATSAPLRCSLAIIAGMYAVYHGPEGLRRIAGRVHGLAVLLTKVCGRSWLRHRQPGIFRYHPGAGDPDSMRTDSRAGRRAGLKSSTV